MSIEFDEYQLIELFESEPTIIDKEAEIYQYQLKDKLGLELFLYFSVYDQYVAIRLEHRELGIPIYDVEVKNVEEIRADNVKLLVIKQNQDQVAEIMLKPNFNLGLSL